MFLKTAFIALVLFAGPARAAVIYQLADGETTFRYTASDFISASLVVAAADLDSCTTFSGLCSSIRFRPDESIGGNLADRIDFTRLFPGAGTLGGTYVFAANAFDGFGVYADPTGATLTVSAGAIPEPASWALMVMGFATVGVAIRRRYRLPFTATLSGRSSPNTRW